MVGVVRIFQTAVLIYSEVLPPHLQLLTVKPYTLINYTSHHYL